jgi:DNA repair exonuclease SbcCD ATPase subunit
LAWGCRRAMILGKIRGKNFFSIGNAFLEIDIKKYKRSVFTGANGNGKSTIANMITFLFFGKTIKNVTKAQIVNSINGKACLVEGEFTDGGNEYMVRRGIKPVVFEIYKNGELVDQSAAGDYQEFLEEKILKCTYRTFLQTSIISIENYQPFMSLPKAGRRSFIEDILDIEVFTVMNTLTKTKITKTKDELKLLDVKIKGLREKIIIQKAYIDKIEGMKKTELGALEEKFKKYSTELNELNASLLKFGDKKRMFDDRKLELHAFKTDRDLLNREIDFVKTNIKSLEKGMVFFETNSDCPSCRQGISHDHVAAIRNDRNEKYAALSEEKYTLSQKLELYVNLDDDIVAYQSELSAHNSEISVTNSSITRLNTMIYEVQSEKEKLNVSEDVSDQKAELKSSAKEALLLNARQTKLNDEQNYNTVMLELFKDSGVKSKIVDQYIPVINKMVNEYLDKFEFFVSFNLDSEFVETIKSRHRDDFTYSSFSAGERMRIDLALLFTFRRLAKMRNSFSSNLLLCDEIFDASLDSNGIDLLLSIFDDEEFNDTNLMVISHANKELFEDSFDGLYEFTKRDGFSEMKEE